MRKVFIYPSILSADFCRLAEEIALVENAGADGIHLDVMDGHFVPNISFGPPIIRSVRKVTELPFWAHLMIEEPRKYLKAFSDAGANGIVVHAEVEDDLVLLADTIHDLGLEAGVALNPKTDVKAIEDVLDPFERLLIMTVNPGFGGQSFMSEPLKKIRILRERTASWSRPPVIEVDGGIDPETAPRAVEAGADALVAGSAVFHADDPASALKSIREEAERVIRLGS